MLDFATDFFAARRFSTREDEEIVGQADGDDGFVRALGKGGERVLGRLQDGKPAAITEMEACVADGDARAGVGGRTERIFDYEFASFLACPRMIEGDAERVGRSELVFLGQV